MAVAISFQGVSRKINNGSYDKQFFEIHSKIIAYHHLKDRKLVKIDNPFLSKETPFENKKLWYDPFAATPASH